MANDGQEQAKRDRNIRYSYRDKHGEVQDKFTSDSRSVIFTLEKSGSKLEFGVAELIKDDELCQRFCTEAPMALMALLFGLKTTTGNAVTAVKSGDAGEMFDALEERKSTICDGEWREGGTRGPNPADVLLAMSNWYKSKKGNEPDDTWLAKAKGRIKELGTKTILLDKEILAEHEAVKLAKVQANLNKLRAEAQAGSDDQPILALADLMD